jgi:hypothetical protein
MVVCFDFWFLISWSVVVLQRASRFIHIFVVWGFRITLAGPTDQ